MAKFHLPLVFNACLFEKAYNRKRFHLFLQSLQKTLILKH